MRGDCCYFADTLAAAENRSEAPMSTRHRLSNATPRGGSVCPPLEIYENFAINSLKEGILSNFPKVEKFQNVGIFM